MEYYVISTGYYMNMTASVGKLPGTSDCKPQLRGQRRALFGCGEALSNPVMHLPFV